MEEPNVPKWLTADFLKTCLESKTDEAISSKIVISHYTVEAAVKAGNNYKAEMLRVKIHYKKQDTAEDESSVSIIVKAPMTGGVMEFYKELADVLYEREPKYYNEFIEQTYKISKHDLVPKSYVCPVPKCVVMEDLKASGYTLVDRQKLLDFEHCQLYINASAKLHALSIAINKKNPELIQSLVRETPGMTKNMYMIFKTILTRGLLCMAAYLEDYPNYKEQLNIINRLKENDTLLNLILEMAKTERPLKALIQEDPWSANMMFKYNDSGTVTSVKLFDFQRLKFTSPVMELVLFVWGAMHPCIRETKLNDVYASYCDSLNKNLAEFGCSERLSLGTMREEITSMSPMVMFIVCAMLPIYIADGVADVNEYLTQDPSKVPVKESNFYKLFQGTYFKKYYPQVLDQVNREGIFNFFKQKLEQSGC